MSNDSNETQCKGVDKKARQYAMGVFRVQTYKNKMYRHLIMTGPLKHSNENIFSVMVRSYNEEYLERIP